MNDTYLISGYEGAAIVRIEGGKAEVLSLPDAGRKPTWSVVNGDIIYMVEGLTMKDHGRTGCINVFRTDGRTAVKVSSVDTGEDPVSLALSPKGRLLAAADYVSGDTMVFRKKEDGTLTDPQRFPYQGHGRDPRRQEAPHPHSVLFIGDTLYTADLGLDVIHTHRVDETAGQVTFSGDIRMPEGSGPRDLREGENGTLLVAGELDSRLYFIDLGTGRIKAAHPTTVRRCMNWPGSVVWMDGHAYVSNRGADTIAEIDEKQGLRMEWPTVSYPRFMDVIDSTLFTLGQHDDGVEMRDAGTMEATASFTFHIPTCIRRI